MVTAFVGCAKRNADVRWTIPIAKGELVHGYVWWIHALGSGVLDYLRIVLPPGTGCRRGCKQL
ncbi:hypothetical protein C7445_103235 [Alicyclobacillus sacchari]|uniref:Uncharacterized protein n=1 Tax=Alicyclobacillus sacchari TaxID=392010 RepID=A0A4R8LRG3_9BACL|nr:hypothetical protein C7445_103235 [Alicyclobacillus sacchari]